jgi:hypothetical protein
MRFDFGELAQNILLGIIVLFAACAALIGVISLWKDFVVR